LDTLTKEESLMTAARTFEATHDVNINVKATQELTQHVDNKVTVIEEVLQQVDGNIYDIRADVDVIKEGTRGKPIVSVSCNVPIISYSKIAIDEIQRLFLPDTAVWIIVSETHS
jgi:hypothetical protein